MDAEMTENDIITERDSLDKAYATVERKCHMIEEFEDPGTSPENIISQCSLLQKSIAYLSLFAENQTAKEIHTEDLKFLALPYYMGFLYGRISNPRNTAITQSKNYLEAFLNLIKIFNCEDEELFPPNIMKTWGEMKENESFAMDRDQTIANHKEKKLIETRYQNSIKIKEESDKRQSIKDFITLKIYEAVNQIKAIKEELKILAYKDSIENNVQVQEKHEQELNKPIPKMKIWHIQKPSEIQQGMMKQPLEKRSELVTQVWQQNKNQPTMTLREVAQLQEDNMIRRMEREKKQREENKEDTDSDKEEVDARNKKKEREWDDWKDANEKGAGNRGNR